MRLLVLLFVVLIVYGSLFPATGWTVPATPLFDFLVTLPARSEKADLVQNVLAYIPLGLFMAAWLMRAGRPGRAIAAATLFGAALSLAMETIQQYLPSRNPSVIDLALNIGGTLGGGLLATLLRGELTAGLRLGALRGQWLRAGTLPNLGLAALALWVLAQTSPLVPTFDLGQIRSGLSLLYWTLRQPDTLQLAPSAVYACHIAGLGLLLRTLMRPGRGALLPFLALVGVVFLLKIIVEGRQLSLEAVTGGACAFIVLALTRNVQAHKPLAYTAMLLIGGGFAIAELTPALPDSTWPFNWIPLMGQMQSLTGLQNILEIFWPFFAIACLARTITPPYRRMEVGVAGSVVVLCIVFWLEWAQQTLPGRFGDITQVVLAWAGWIVPWAFGGIDYADKSPAAPVAPVRARA